MKKLSVLLVILLTATLFAGCGNGKAGAFNDYFSKVGKNVEELKKVNEDFQKVASKANKAEDLKNVEQKLAQGEEMLNKVLSDYKNTEEPKELTQYKKEAIRNLNNKLEQVSTLKGIITYINVGDIKNPDLNKKLNKLSNLEKEINKKDKSNSELLSKIAKDNNLKMEIKSGKTTFESI